MKRNDFSSRVRRLAALLVGTGMVSATLQAQPILYALTSTNSLLILSGDGQTIIPGPALSGMGAGEAVVAIDFRPFTSELYALSRDGANAGRVYTVHPVTGVMTPVTLSGPALTLTGSVGMDFNPAAVGGTNALRIVTSDKQNYRLVLNASGAVVNVDSALNVPGGGGSINVIATAYANNRAGLPGSGGAGGTVQYAIDADTDTLYRVNPPNGGVLTNALPLGINISGHGGLDIVTGTDRAVGVFSVASAVGLYEVNLATGAATLIAPLPDAVVDIAAPIPSPQPTPVVYGLTSTNSLVRFSADGGPIVGALTLTGLGSAETVVAIDFRPFTGQLFALSRDANNQGRLYTVNLTSGAMTPIVLSATLNLAGSVGMDFNPAAASGNNALRIVTSQELNYRLLFSSSGATVNLDSMLNVPGGASGTNIIATAYSNNRSGLPGGAGGGGTVQFAIDSDTDTLYRVNPPNGGVLTMGLPLGVDVGSVGGLDIVTGTDRALGLFNVSGATAVYEVNLTTGAATPTRFLPNNIVDLAVPMPVVFPSTMLLGLTRTNSLVTFNTDGGTIAGGIVIAGLGAGENVMGIDFRPLTGELYAVSRGPNNVGHVYTIDLASGLANEVPLTGAPLIISGSVGIDFNPAAVNGANALRIVTGDEQNYRLIFSAGGATVNADTPLNVSGGASGTNVIATAYSNNRAGLPGGGGAGGTVQYAIDADLDVLYRVNPPNGGVLTNALSLGLDLRSVGGLDIVTVNNRALAVFDTGDSVGLYEVNLANGVPALIRSLPLNITDLAVPMPSIGQMRFSGVGSSLNLFGGVGPFAVQRGDVVNEAFCTVATTTQRAVPIVNDGSHGFFRLADLAAAPPVRLTVSLTNTTDPTSSSMADGFGTLEVSGSTLTFDVGYRGLIGTNAFVQIRGGDDDDGVSAILIDLTPFCGSGRVVGSVGLAADEKAAILGSRLCLSVISPEDVAELCGQVTPAVYKTILTGAAERPDAVFTSGYGFGLFSLIGNELAFNISYRGLGGTVLAAHLHGPAPGSGVADVLFDLAPFNGGAFGAAGSLVGKIRLTPAQRAVVASGKTYVNLHTARFMGGEVRGQVLPVITATPFAAELTGAASRPMPVTTPGAGFASLLFQGDTLSFYISYRNLLTPAIAAHFHGPAPASGAAGVQIDLAPTHRGPFSTEGFFVGSVPLTPEQKAILLAGDFYINIHTSGNEAGEIRGQVIPVVLQASLSGAAERPTPMNTPGNGFGYLAALGRQLSIGLRYSDLTGPATSAHLHGPAAADGTADVLIDLGPLAAGGLGASGFLLGTVPLTDPQTAAVADGLTYVNIHTATNVMGEIRGQVVP